jgi:HPt (histidine-containing phosphotransfer) domain-containing protein
VKPTTSPISDQGVAPADASFEPNGIDTLSGLANTGGDREFYRRMLRLFRQREADFEQRFHAARAAGDAEAAMRTAHDLKCEAGTLGMHGLEQSAAALERACMQGARDADVDGMVQELSGRLHEVIDELGAVATPNALTTSGRA